MKNDKTLRLLTPSWVVNVVGLGLGIALTAGTIILSQYQESDLRRQIFEVQTNGAITGNAYDAVTRNFASNNLLNALPLLLVWAAVGLVVYYFAAAIARAFGEAVELHDELGYVHVSRKALLREAVLRLGLRAAAVIGWFVLIKLSLSILIPYALSAANIASQSFNLQNAGYAVLAVAVIYAAIWLNAIFLRLIALRPRLFGNSDS